MAGAERVERVGHHVLDARHRARLERLRLLVAVPELAPHHLAADELLISAHARRPAPLDRAVGGRRRPRVGVRVDVDELHHPVRVGAGRRHLEARPDRAGQRHVGLEHVGHVGQHVRATGGETLVVHHVRGRHADGDVIDVRDRLGRVADVLVEGLAAGRRGPGEPAARREVERLCGGLRRRPGVHLPPLVPPGLEHVGFGQPGVRRVLQVVLEERELDLLLEEAAGLRAEPHVAEVLAVARPPAVGPRPHDEGVRRAGAVALDVLVGLERAEEVLGVEPAADGQDGGLDALEVRPEVARLPEGVVRLVRHHLVPEGDRVLQVERVRVRERHELLVELVPVLGAEVEPRTRLRRRGRARLPEAREEAEGVRQVEGAVVMEVVADEPVGDGRLGRHGLERGVGVDHAGGGVEARVRDAPHAHAAVVPGDVLQQPLDRVVRVRALVDVRRARLLREVRPHVDELALRHHPPAHVLVDEDVALAHEAGGRPETVLVRVGAVGRHAVGRAVEENRVGRAAILGHVHGREELHAVAHRDAVLELGIGRLDRFRRLAALRACRAGSHRHERGHRRQRPPDPVPAAHPSLPSSGRRPATAPATRRTASARSPR